MVSSIMADTDLLNFTVPAVGPEESLQSLLDESNRTESSNSDTDLLEVTSAADFPLLAEVRDGLRNHGSYL